MGNSMNNNRRMGLWYSFCYITQISIVLKHAWTAEAKIPGVESEENAGVRTAVICAWCFKRSASLSYIFLVSPYSCRSLLISKADQPSSTAAMDSKKKGGGIVKKLYWLSDPSQPPTRLARLPLGFLSPVSDSPQALHLALTILLQEVQSRRLWVSILAPSLCYRRLSLFPDCNTTFKLNQRESM